MNHPPKLIVRLLELLIKDVYADEIIGDLYEWYESKSSEYRHLRLLWYASLFLIGSLNRKKLKSTSNIFLRLIDSTMLNNQLRMSFKTLLNQKAFTLINIIGLTSSLAAVIFILSYIKYELSFDQFHSKSDQVYRIIKKDLGSGELGRPTPTPLASAFQSQLGDAIEFARFGQDPVFAQIGEDRYYEENFYWGDSSIFDVFTIPFIHGEPKNALTEPNSVVISESIAKKYFGNINPVGKIIPIKVYDGDANYSMRVDGVFKDLPTYSDLPFEILGSMQNALTLYERFNKSWGMNWLHTYALVKDEDVERVVQSIPNIIEHALGKEFVDVFSFQLQPLDEVHLYSADINGAKTSGNINYIIILAAIAVITMIIAAFNYLNLMASTINKRRKYVGINKILGATKKTLFSQFLLESLLTITISFILAYFLVLALWPYYTSLISAEIPISMTYELSTVIIYLIIVSATCLLSGIQPAYLLSRIRGNSQGLQNNVTQKVRFQKGLLACQFAIAIFLFCSTYIIYQQVHYVSNQSLGFNADQLLSIKVEDRLLQTKIEQINEQISSIIGVKESTVSGESLPSQMNNTGSFHWNDKSSSQGLSIQEVAVRFDFFDVLDIPILEGRIYHSNNNYQEKSEVVINEAARALIGEDWSLNQNVFINGRPHQVVGVVGNYHYASMKSKIEPVVYFQTEAGSRLSYDNIIVRISGQDIQATLQSLEKVWTQFSSNEFFSFHFIDESFDEIYQSDRRFLALFSVFAGLSILITCLGLFGMMLFTADQQAKEISIRKVLGSTQVGIIYFVLKQFMVLIAAGFLVGIPFAWYFSVVWKSQFVYQAPESAFNFIISGLLMLLFALLAIARNTLKVSFSNPTDYLRSE